MSIIEFQTLFFNAITGGVFFGFIVGSLLIFFGHQR
jgi:hypothetical protein